MKEVINRLQCHGIRLKLGKCSFPQESVEYLGHHIDAEGLHTTSRKVEAVQLREAICGGPMLMHQLRI